MTQHETKDDGSFPLAAPPSNKKLLRLAILLPIGVAFFVGLASLVAGALWHAPPERAPGDVPRFDVPNVKDRWIDGGPRTAP